MYLQPRLRNRLRRLAQAAAVTTFGIVLLAPKLETLMLPEVLTRLVL